MKIKANLKYMYTYTYAYTNFRQKYNLPFDPQGGRMAEYVARNLPHLYNISSKILKSVSVGR